MGEYSVLHFGDMLADRGRVDAYLQALEEAVKPGSTVLDLGTGTGFFALKACDFGAGKVYAIDPNPSIELAREFAFVNGRADQIEFIQALSTEVDLPSRVDVIISDLRGISPLYRGHIASLSDARDRLLKPGGTMIPLRDELWCAPISSPGAWGQYSIWTNDYHGLDLTAGARYARNIPSTPIVESSEITAPPQRWALLDYQMISEGNASGTVRWKPSTAFDVDGLYLWFEAILSDSSSFTSGPLRSGGPARAAITYRRNFYPLLESIRVEKDDELVVTIDGRRTEGLGGDYSWRWTTTLTDTVGTLKTRFDQSTLLGMPIPKSKS